ncbi:hypothetical protein [Labrys neptuniae]|uniref:PD-(D/E)XK nuclease family protein n=1 Tax=Labrys neptuniae TaxID=376174 RepID=A0ABV3PIK0_9HYPH
MLSAILNGKGRCLPESVKAGDSLRKVFVRSEDILTSTIFERLAYLDGAILWQIIGNAFRPMFLPERKIVNLIEIEFWPTWGQGRQLLNQAVQPDVVLRLSAGDPAQIWTLIVECKLGGRQEPGQWAREWLAYLAENADSESSGEIWLVALGGLMPGGPEYTVAKFTEIIRREHGATVAAVAADWSDLLKTLDRVEVSDTVNRRIIDDMKAALELHGFRQTLPMSDLIGLASHYATHGASFGALRWSDN